MFCNKCGSKLDKNTNFCSYCGEIQAADNTSNGNNYNHSYTPNNNQMYSSNQNHSFNNMQQAPPPMYNPNYSQPYSGAKKNQTTMIVVIISVLALLITATVLFFVFKDNFFENQGDSNQSNTSSHGRSSKRKRKKEDSIQESTSEKKSPDVLKQETRTESAYEDNSDSDTAYDRVNDELEDLFKSDDSNSEYDDNSYEYDNSTDRETYTYNNYILPDSDTRYYFKSELYELNKEKCRLARNELYARHGRLFDDPDLQAYFNSQSWYVGYIDPDHFQESMLNEYEIANRNLIVEYEEDMGYR